MVTKIVSPGAKTTRRKATAAPEAADRAVIACIKSAQSLTAVTTSIDPQVRRQLVAAEAYFLAERRGFAAGHELEDWVAAEAAVDSRGHEIQAALA
ncbi:MAG: DUF2934 domain-containing protein [Steroidobacteraceae bacterium]